MKLVMKSLEAPINKISVFILFKKSIVKKG